MRYDVTSTGIDSSPTPPALDELEISVFGKGIGECIVGHIGGGEWIVVDSCIGEREPIALEYLQKIGAEAAKVIKLVIISHWHDDHSAGISSVASAAETATIAFAQALTTKEFVTVVKAYSKDPLLPGSSGVDEMERTYDVLRHRRRAGNIREISIGPRFTGADRRLFQRPVGSIPPVEVWSLSPSDAAAQLFLHEIGEWGKPSKNAKRRLVSQDPNTLASVIWIDFDGYRVLLGSDLETSRNPSMGWLAIINSLTRPQGRAQVFKIPHHGSITAHEDMTWTDLVQGPISLVTPYNSSQLPKPTDAARIRELSSQSFIASKPSMRPVLPKDAAVAKTLREQQRTIWRRSTKMGQVRLRWRQHEDPRIELFGAASPL